MPRPLPVEGSNDSNPSTWDGGHLPHTKYGSIPRLVARSGQCNPKPMSCWQWLCPWLQSFPLSLGSAPKLSQRCVINPHYRQDFGTQTGIKVPDVVLIHAARAISPSLPCHDALPPQLAPISQSCLQHCSNHHSNPSKDGKDKRMEGSENNLI